MIELYQAAEDLGVEIFCGNIPETVSMSVPGAICMDASLVYGGAVERVHFAHELGHCARGAFYTRQDPPWIRKRCEHKADKWAIKKLVPKDELKKAVSAGYTEPWQLAEYFDVTESFIALAMWYYQNGNLSLEAKQ